MSEYIDNTSKRKEIIKNILKALNAGKSIEDVRQEFKGLLEDVDAASITEVEQMLIEEGTPAEEIQRLCDVHATFFRNSLDKQASPESMPGHPIHTFQAENRAVIGVLDELQRKFEVYMNRPDQGTHQALKQQLARLMEYDRHFVRKENLLFSVLERYGFFGPSQVMWGIHNDIRNLWKNLSRMVELPHPPSIGNMKEVLSQLDTTIREMIYKEDKILFPTALERLSPEDWQHIREQEPEVGYAYIEAGTGWATSLKNDQKPVPVAQKETPPAHVKDLIPLKTGALTSTQIDLLLRTLPVDVTLVDEKDEVRYFSQTRERIFQRSPAIIGRKVQNCHPPQSIGKVQQILDDFKAGRRDVAEFWIQMQGKFIVIQYFALRDEQGKYKGTIEVSQEASHLRSLQGEKRLLDDVPSTKESK